jgi:PHD/YefM family antitoxin component YafN of YafNO toxin-antitoxin module
LFFDPGGRPSPKGGDAKSLHALTVGMRTPIIFAMAEEKLTQVSSAAFTENPQRFLDEARAGHVVEISGPELEPLVLISKEELEGYKATAELLANPEDRAALLKSLAELANRPTK